MRVLVVGGGGREHALVHSFAQSTLADRIFCAPGNAGTAEIADNIGVGAEDLPALLDFASREQVDLTVVGPEAPLVAGICDLFEEHGLAVFGPNRDAAQLEGSKVFAKEIMAAGGVATGAYRKHDHRVGAPGRRWSRHYPLVVKADGLAAGKGVIICNDHAEARAAVESCFVARDFGAAGDVVIIEEFLAGSEVSLLVLCDGRNAVPLAPAQDYKRIFAGDQGPNTGGMGSYCPVPGFEQKAIDAAMEHVAEPVIAALRKRDIAFRGVLYAGLIVTDAGVKVLEFNCRFGDPETQAVLPRLDSDLLELCAAGASGELAGVKAAWKPQECVTVVMASAGYPASSHKGDVISGLAAAAPWTTSPCTTPARRGRTATSSRPAAACSPSAPSAAASPPRASAPTQPCARSPSTARRYARTSPSARSRRRPANSICSRPGPPAEREELEVEEVQTEVETILQGIQMEPVLVGIVMGSESDREVMEAACKELDERKIKYELNVLSAHRDPDKVAHYARTAQSRGIKVLIGGAGKAAALPGVLAAYTNVPVIGVPIKTSDLGGLDSLLSIVQMPPGVPVACVAINGARNAAILAAKILDV